MEGSAVLGTLGGMSESKIPFSGSLNLGEEEEEGQSIWE